MTCFMEQYALEHGALPRGMQRIRVNGPPIGYTGGDHDFGDLALPSS